MSFKRFFMDVRNTVVTPEIFLAELAEYQENHHEVSLIIDKDGLTRVTGHIVCIHADENILKTRIDVEDSSFLLEELVAVNGLFRSDYSEC